MRRALSLLAVSGLVWATGCESANSRPVASMVPPPSFAAPTVTGGKVASGGARLPAPTGTASAYVPAMVNGVPRDWIPNQAPRQWRWIIIHHTATPSGALARIDASHRSKGWENGAGYDFVVGNGSESRDGQIEASPRWSKQIDGAHTHTPDQRFNKLGIGIVLVGNFDETRPSKAQVSSTARLVAYLMRTYRIPADRVIAHRDTKPTDCPGRYTSVAQLRSMATQILADAGVEIPKSERLALSADTELLK